MFDHWFNIPLSTLVLDCFFFLTLQGSAHQWCSGYSAQPCNLRIMHFIADKCPSHTFSSCSTCSGEADSTAAKITASRRGRDSTSPPPEQQGSSAKDLLGLDFGMGGGSPSTASQGVGSGGMLPALTNDRLHVFAKRCLLGSPKLQCRNIRFCRWSLRNSGWGN